MNKAFLWVVLAGLLIAGCQEVEETAVISVEETAVYPTEQAETPATALPITPTPPPTQPTLADIDHWFYYLGFEPDGEILQEIVDSDYDLVVMEPVFTDRENVDFPVADLITDLHNADHPKLVIAYVDIGQAEDWRTYWQSDWEIGDPEWIVADDPDGWEGNYPVAYWYDEWQEIWLNSEDGYLKLLTDAGFDGIYLDWVEAYSDENVITAADEDDVDAEEEMVEWVRLLGENGRLHNQNFIVIAQNAAELVENDEYVTLIDGLAQEQTWFDGAADNEPPGDCPLPRTEDDVETAVYYKALLPSCQQLHDDFPDSTLHVSSESYLYYLTMAQDKGLPILTIDYAIQPDNVDEIYSTSRQHGFVPFTSERALDVYQPLVP